MTMKQLIFEHRLQIEAMYESHDMLTNKEESLEDRANARRYFSLMYDWLKTDVKKLMKEG